MVLPIPSAMRREEDTGNAPRWRIEKWRALNHTAMLSPLHSYVWSALHVFMMPSCTGKNNPPKSFSLKNVNEDTAKLRRGKRVGRKLDQRRTATLPPEGCLVT